MKAMDHNGTQHGLREWWASPPRDGMQRMLPPWEYRNLRGFARVHLASGGVLVVLGLVTLIGGGNTPKASAWASAFLAVAVLQFLVAAWLLGIARVRPRAGHDDGARS